jgi:hypothetical protein
MMKQLISAAKRCIATTTLAGAVTLSACHREDPVNIIKNSPNNIIKNPLVSYIAEKTELDGTQYTGEIQQEWNFYLSAEKRTQKAWNVYFYRQRLEDVTMASMPEIYNIAKYADKESLETLRKRLKDNALITNTRVTYHSYDRSCMPEVESLETQYHPDDLSAKIKHTFSGPTHRMTEHNVTLPNYSHCPDGGGKSGFLDKILHTKDQEGVAYLQTLFGTSDDIKQITDTLQKLSNHEPNSILISTDSPENRQDLPLQMVGFTDRGGWWMLFTEAVDFEASSAIGITHRVTYKPKKHLKTK